MSLDAPKVFLSYRRDDTLLIIGRIAEALALEQIHVYLDIDSIPAGQPWRTVIDQQVAQCDVVVVVIGRNWECDRLRDSDDFVRYEIASSLRLGKPIIPLRVGREFFPNREFLPDDLLPILDLQGARLSVDREFKSDITLLAQQIHALHRSAAACLHASDPIREVGSGIGGFAPIYVVPALQFDAAVRRAFHVPDGDRIEYVWQDVDGDVSTGGLSRRIERITAQSSSSSPVRVLYHDDFGWNSARNNACIERLDSIVQELRQIGLNPPKNHYLGFLASASEDNSTLAEGEYGLVFWERHEW